MTHEVRRAIRSIGASAALIAAFFALPLVASATEYRSTNFILRDPIFDSGGRRLDSANFTILDATGEPVVGAKASASFQSPSGHWSYPISVPPALTVTTDVSQATLDWTAPVIDQPGYVLANYSAGYSTTPGGPYTYINAGNALTTTVPSLAPGTYYFIVRALNASGLVLANSGEVSAAITAISGSFFNYCGNNQCDSFETSESCPADCPPPISVVPPAPIPIAPPVLSCPISCQDLRVVIMILNPDGTIRRSDDRKFVRTVQLSDGVLQYRFDDNGSDFDYDDVVINVDGRDCASPVVAVMEVNAGWHHQIQTEFSYASASSVVFVSSDSHQSVGISKIVDGKTAEICGAAAAAAASDAPDAAPLFRVSDILKGQGVDTVYYIGRDGLRHPFPHLKVFQSWYEDFSSVRNVELPELLTLGLGRDVRYRPAVRLVKKVSDPKVYAVAAHGVLRWVTTQSVAQRLFGSSWNKLIDDLSDILLADYAFGPQLGETDQFDAASEQAGSSTIDQDLDLPVNESGIVAPAPEKPVCIADTEFVDFLAVGSANAQVLSLQQLLQCLGYFPADVTPSGYYGAITEAAVKEFQAANGIEPLGYVGPATREALNRY